MRRLAALLAIAFVFTGCSSKKPVQSSPTNPPLSTSTAAASPTASPCAVAGATTQSAQASGTGKQALLTDVRHVSSGCARVVFEFENVPPAYTVSYQNPPFANCGSGARVDTSSWGSSAYLMFHSNQASGVDLAGPSFRTTYKGSKDIAVAGPVVRRIHETCDFEATLNWLIALDARHPFKVSVLSGPPRLVIDISQAPA